MISLPSGWYIDSRARMHGQPGLSEHFAVDLLNEPSEIIAIEHDTITMTLANAVLTWRVVRQEGMWVFALLQRWVDVHETTGLDGRKTFVQGAVRYDVAGAPDTALAQHEPTPVLPAFSERFPDNGQTPVQMSWRRALLWTALVVVLLVFVFGSGPFVSL